MINLIGHILCNAATHIKMITDRNPYRPNPAQIYKNALDHMNFERD